MTPNPREIALTYIAACGNKDLTTVARLLAPDVRVVGPNRTIEGADAYLQALRRLGPIWLRSDVKQVFTDGSDVCVLYDFISDSSAGAVPIVESLSIQDGRIASVALLFDRVAFQPASDELTRRATA